jgi:hypothetical protein
MCCTIFILNYVETGSGPARLEVRPAPRCKWLISLFSIIRDCENSAETLFSTPKKVDVAHATKTSDWGNATQRPIPKSAKVGQLQAEAFIEDILDNVVLALSI